MARRAPRREQVSVAELLVRSAVREDAPARHRQQSPGARALARVRVFSVVAGALALTGGVAAAALQPYEHAAGAVWPPVGLDPVPVTLTPKPVDAVVSPGTLESAAPTPRAGGITPTVTKREANFVKAPVRKALPVKKVTPVRHAIPDVPAWSHGHAAKPDRHAVRAAGHRDGGHGHHRGGGGRHRR
ncbi:hypothetical protein VA596_00925 [Amycolatopsis sp., V23-08]|uniref:Uncharacterized protein n=1 Tax=Amycolatopsis heterodermiae TaxID=3110235 RepID=A0ABU5QVZ8_9PSEU|nr:hypothetical protein [Amycolatopsis sp., V23-08]MEA5358082.1 hypothetical protein [Amycolatopsis sp., V23-08]